MFETESEFEAKEVEKKCTTCLKIKPLSDFHSSKTGKYGKASKCKECCSVYDRKIYLENSESIKKRTSKNYYENREKCWERGARWHKKNPKKRWEYERKYAAKNPEQYKKMRKEIAKKYYMKNPTRPAEWAAKNPEKRKEIVRRCHQKRRETPDGKLNHSMSSLVWRALKKNKKGSPWELLVGFTLKQLKQHLEKLFVEGMTWENYGEWHVDHKIPIAVFNFKTPTDLDFKRCWELNNLQPLWAAENLSKRDKIKQPFQPSLLLEDKTS